MSALVLLILSGIWTYSHYPNNESVFAIESQKEYSNEVLIENTNKSN